MNTGPLGAVKPGGRARCGWSAVWAQECRLVAKWGDDGCVGVMGALLYHGRRQRGPSLGCTELTLPGLLGQRACKFLAT